MFARNIVHTSLTPVFSRGLRAACIVERLPVVTPEPTAWQASHAAWKFSLKSRFFKPIQSDWADASTQVVDEDAFASQFKTAPRRTAADEKKDTSTLQRALDRRLYLLVKTSEKKWDFPSAEYNPGSDATLRAVAERACPKIEGKVYFVGNAPVHHLGDVFMFRAQLVKGDVSASEEHVWVTKSELPQFMDPEVAGKVADALWD